ncbi:hypothetical protein CRG98_044499 [Punica granatum]|uniref:Uncharacterized protein n=1 Tax=Punica granatum TaxID=22663 RepID=A0A2I0HUE0_PUNGR|nr:hypothetical protein CRG98_044499 [Punica granatum]
MEPGSAEVRAGMGRGRGGPYPTTTTIQVEIVGDPIGGCSNLAYANGSQRRSSHHCDLPPITPLLHPSLFLSL